MGAFQDLSGLRFGRLTVVGRDVTIAARTRWVCKCDCGKGITALRINLKSGNTGSCGCTRYVSRRANNCFNKNLTEMAEYRSWESMKARCLNPNATSYENYGGRGITVCAEWRDDFPKFIQDVGHRPSKEYSIDRIDTDGNYEPGNVRWATAEEQQNNKRRNVYVLHRGKKMTVSQVLHLHALGNLPHHHPIRNRIRAGWPIDLAIETPVRKKKRNGG